MGSASAVITNSHLFFSGSFHFSLYHVSASFTRAFDSHGTLSLRGPFVWGRVAALCSVGAGEAKSEVNIQRRDQKDSFHLLILHNEWVGLLKVG